MKDSDDKDDQNSDDFVSRRRSVQMTAVGALAAGAREMQSDVTLPPPEQTGIEHIVVVMMENRSFDHFLGWVPGREWSTSGACVHRWKRFRRPHIG